MNIVRKIRIALCATVMLGAVLPVTGRNAPKGGYDIRGFYVDARHEVMTIDALKAYADQLSKAGINTLLMEYEATFPFKKHATLRNEYAYTEDEIKDFVAYCADRGIDVIPLQNCFGHCEYILRHERYRALREDKKEISQVCPLAEEEAKKIFREIFAEVAALHPSQYFHIGADETRLLGRCPKCAAKVAEQGVSKLFVDYVKIMAEIVLEMGKTPVMWADIILKHPEAVGELPKELIFIDWNYGWDVNRFGSVQTLIDAGVKMWGATAFRSGPDHIYLTQWEKHLKNLTDFIPFGRQSGYWGMINTSWSTSGEYGYHYDGAFSMPNNMQPIRSVYPQIGMNMLVEAFCEAVQSDEPLDGKKFAFDYACRRFGLKKADAETVVAYYFMPQQVISASGKDKLGKPIADVLSEAIAMRDQLAAITPKKNAEEFEHLKLMLDLRINYLQFRQIEIEYELPSYDISKASQLLERLEPVVKESYELDKRFIAACDGYLKDGQAEKINAERSERMRWLYNVLVQNAK